MTTRTNWREYLTKAERFDLDAVEANARDLDNRRKALTRNIRMLRDRAQHRRKWREDNPKAADEPRVPA